MATFHIAKSRCLMILKQNITNNWKTQNNSTHRMGKEVQTWPSTQQLLLLPRRSQLAHQFLRPHTPYCQRQSTQPVHFAMLKSPLHSYLIIGQ